MEDPQLLPKLQQQNALLKKAVLQEQQRRVEADGALEQSRSEGAALRARVGDIALLATHFGRRMSNELGWPSFPGFSPQAFAALAKHEWPGNIRELRNAVERAVYLHSSPDTPVETLNFDPFESPFRPAPAQSTAVTPKSQPAAARATNVADATAVNAKWPINLKSTLAELEIRLLTEALEINRHNQKDAAKHLGLGYHQFRSRLRKYAIG